MTATSQDFIIYAGDAAVLAFTVSGPNHDISTVNQITWTARRDLTSATVLQKTKTGGGITFATDGTDGKFNVDLAGADTTVLSGFYIYSASVTDNTGAVNTVSLGRMQVGQAPIWSYSGDPSVSDKDAVRFFLGDTDGTSPQVYDGEIAFALTARGTTYGATAMCALALAAKYSRLVNISADGMSQALGQKAAAFRAVATEYLSKEAVYGAAAYAGGISISDMRTILADTDRVPDLFRYGMLDNPPSDGVNPEPGNADQFSNDPGRTF
jgi:hypothetical protein